MAYQDSPRGFCRLRSYPSEGELSTGQQGCSTSECSSSTCDTTGSQRRGTKSKFVGLRMSPLRSLKRVSRPRILHPCDASSSAVICTNCDALRMQLTEATTQCYDQWIKRINVLEEMLQEKQKIVDELQAAWYERCQVLEQAQRLNTELQQKATEYLQKISDLKDENYKLCDTVKQKEEFIEELCDDAAQLREKNKHNQKLRQLDLLTIEKLRRAAKIKKYRNYRKPAVSSPRCRPTLSIGVAIRRAWRHRLSKYHSKSDRNRSTASKHVSEERTQPNENAAEDVVYVFDSSHILSKVPHSRKLNGKKFRA
ncbi:uncharacterized protein BXIN_1270 [Babesia sp. Xinjiang]|uniref:uncharacterized protein n=1 Tax=Babesia sp. Xinjiang TaxID=462227 RepID=UPI000A264506|nr:uncharacterized protein BXIN_1270 [Babesia sp. Xinjiang]ORM40024.1 hypothetical protein BXIN_1270 [Babesia sp. Xinjiang]